MSQLTRTLSSMLIALCGVTLTLIALAHVASAQSTSATDGNTPLGLSPGAAAGSYPLSDLDQIGLFNGDLSFKLPIMHIGGRGAAGYTMMLQPGQESLKWRVWHQIWQSCGEHGCTVTGHSYYPTENWWTAVQPGLSPGVVVGRKSGENPSYPPGCPIGTNFFSFSLTRITFVSADGTEYELRDQRLGVLTGYAQYYNRRYRRVGHLLQGRHKAILCQSDRYLSELVRYIHLNPVRARMVSQPEDYEYSSHRAYLGMEPAGMVDLDPVLRHFGARKDVARDRYRQFVAAGIKQGHREEFYAADQGRILGSEEFIDATIHRIGETGRSNRGAKPSPICGVQPDRLVAVEKVCRIPREEFCGIGKSAPAITAKEMLILIGLKMGASMKVLSEIVGISPSALSRRHDAARLKVRKNGNTSKLASEILQQYRSGE